MTSSVSDDIEDLPRDQPIANKLAFLGAGKMAEAIIGGLPPVNWEHTAASDYNPSRQEVFKTRFGVRVGSDNTECVEGADAVILAVKPQNVPAVLGGIKGLLGPDCVLVSIVAGVGMEELNEMSGCGSIVRTMPNTPAMIGQGITVWAKTEDVTEAQSTVVRRILRAMGSEIFVQDECFLDMATALSGSGPAYQYMMMESMIDAGVHMGFSRDVARMLVLKTMQGSVEYVLQTGSHPATMRDDITSPGGTTAAALYEMERGSFRTVVADSVWAAYRRSLEMGGHNSNVGPGRSSR
jgi:pyrroline-5-carboxylate reductase